MAPIGFSHTRQLTFLRKPGIFQMLIYTFHIWICWTWSKVISSTMSQPVISQPSCIWRIAQPGHRRNNKTYHCYRSRSPTSKTSRKCAWRLPRLCILSIHSLFLEYVASKMQGQVLNYLVPLSICDNSVAIAEHHSLMRAMVDVRYSMLNESVGGG
jgi:hypothetical protein